MELISLALAGGPAQVLTQDRPVLDGPHGVMGLDVGSRTIDGHHWTVVQLLLDDDHPLFDRTLLDAPIVAEVRTHGHRDGGPVALALEPFDHDGFRRQLALEHAAGESTTRGVLVRTGGELPPAYVRLAFLPIELAATAGADLLVRRTTVAELVAGVEEAYAKAAITDDERRALLISIEQRHPTPSA
ncbi:hypothetical protein [Aquihabitans sp. McL0605]|uniref:hypothetical protein n=1 Tax=Aquihabitans sp. McL0605 TaxID=3415671 RepID=UPI003CF59AD0